MSDVTEVKAETLNEKKVMFGKGERDYSVDVVRSISCLMVVTGHVCSFMMERCPYDPAVGITETWNALATLRCMSVSATNMFLMISGIFFLSPERNVTISKIWSKNILKMAVAYVLWCMIYSAFRICYTNHGGAFDWSLLGQDIFWQETLNREYHLWYIPMMLGIYVIVPIMRVFTEHAQRKHYLYIIGLMIGAISLNTLKIFSTYYSYPGSENVITIIDDTPTLLICQYPFYCILGYYLYTYRPKLKTRILLYLLGIAGVCLMIYLTAFFYQETGATNLAEIQSRFTIGVLAKNTALFVFLLTVFSKVKWRKAARVVISKVSAATLFIYLSHILFVRVLIQERWLMDGEMDLFQVGCIDIAVVYVFGFLISLLFLQLIPWTQMRNVVLDAVWPGRRIWNGGKHRSKK